MPKGKDKKNIRKCKKNKKNFHRDEDVDSNDMQNAFDEDYADVESVNFQPSSSQNRNRYNLKYRVEDKDTAEARKKLRHEPIKILSEEHLETSHSHFFPCGLDFPKRPPWSDEISFEEFDMNENRYFRNFCDNIDKFKDNNLCRYELNLETWRQLWRVMEMADIILIIVDARYPVVLFPPYLYEHLIAEKKGAILLLNKCDLIPPSLVLAWKDYFSKHFPELSVVPFISSVSNKQERKLLKSVIECSLQLINVCQKLVNDKVDLSSWIKKVKTESCTAYDFEGCKVGKNLELSVPLTLPERHFGFKDGILTIGTVGNPNVGKSSVINALMGKKVVSVSKTPGHTKHFQTIFLTNNVKLCDCPGLVFPSICCPNLQILIGSYPVAQVRDPVATINYIASRLDLPKILHLSPQEILENEDELQWTSYYICSAWAKKRRYFVRAKGAITDEYRSGNELLRLTVAGQKKLLLYLRPPDYSKNKASYDIDQRIKDIISLYQTQNNERISELNEKKEAQTAAIEKSDESSDEAEDENQKRSFLSQNRFLFLDAEC